MRSKGPKGEWCDFRPGRARCNEVDSSPEVWFRKRVPRRNGGRNAHEKTYLPGGQA